MHQALYRKWRPKTFDDVFGQEHITSILKYEADKGEFNHAYLFCGSRGTGKTTCAKILAKVVNCEHPVGGNPCGQCPACLSIEEGTATDVVEMDAASNNGVDNIRDIRDEVVYTPSALKYRVYIIDEVHMLSGSAFNALLKTLEEPPAHVVFILATTEMHKLPATIVSRCQRFDFRRIALADLMARLSIIAKSEGIELREDGAHTLARLAQGGMRDAISLLELCAGARKPIDAALVAETVGISGRESLFRTVGAVADQNFEVLFDEVARVVASAKDIAVFWQDLISLYRDLLVMRSTTEAGRYLDLTESETETLRKLAARFSKEKLLYHCKLLDEALVTMQRAGSVRRVVAELTLVRMCDPTLDTSNEALATRLADLESRVWAGVPAPVDPTAAPAAPVPEATRPAAPAIPAVPERPAAASSLGTEDAGPKRVLRPLRAWAEIVARMAQSEPAASPFLSTARAYSLEDGSVLVRLDSELAQRMLERGNLTDVLRGVISAEMKRDLPAGKLQVEVMGEAPKNDVLDEIIEAANE